MKFYYNYKYLDGKRVDKPKRFVIPKDEWLISFRKIGLFRKVVRWTKKQRKPLTL
jgi:hypothetical protein